MTARIIALVAALSVGVAADEPARVIVFPALVLEGAIARVACRVAQRPENRSVTWGVELWGASSRELAGDRASLWTEDLWLKDAPCGAGPAFCEVTRAGRVTVRAVAPLTVACRG